MEPVTPRTAGRRFSGLTLLWTIIAAVTVTAVAIASLLGVLLTDSAGPGEDSESVDLGRPSYDGGDTLDYEEFEPGAEQVSCYSAGIDFDHEPEPLYDDPHELDDTIDLDYEICDRAVDDSVRPDFFQMELRSAVQGQSKDHGEVDNAQSCYEAADSGTEDSVREWYVKAPPGGSGRPDPDAFCLFTPDNLVRVTFSEFNRDGEVASVTIDVTVWALP